ncbi:hypothetical protein Kpol_1041p4 [Vanderwaltozyma polyspora DSM 70294]|uniref:RRM domain-containing protein n=1 Tax=Vanderwaltozyma polyspora (strain ATCC 22028 / DSM 70294 / BCRC 21397 / CBS 2163 / NBRC 10782 / NRRL Y-8283 / UCD 57-17) TaxID=436907 RepID=A7TL72_VANPO|nr:uncharacterized protein Kpol_1041p4 [Vanderwaltozyma polyspora DSM 70294]EDO16947.1 hypothetical protein Kpol_1041p4 [Vanderwaltozyma polyspora DSM 70294]
MSKEETLSKEEQIQKALSDPTKKRKAEDEIEIDLSSSVPLSKKQKRLLRRGKITLEELNSKFNIDPASIAEYKKETEESKSNDEESAETKEEAKSSEVVPKDKKKKEKKIGVWIGNLSFDTTKDDIIKFIVLKTKDNEESTRVTEEDIERVNMPLAKNDGKQIKNKGFCYLDFKTDEKMLAVVALSESQLNGRNLLVKNSKDYEGRPDKNDLISMSKNPPSRILFVGNLSFDTTDDLLRKHFQHCGEIIKIRMATFQDTGKCKGFAFVDFKNEEGATKALTDKSCRKIAGRPLRMEFGEDRSKRQVKRRDTSAPPKRDFDLNTNNIPVVSSSERKPVEKKRVSRPSNKQYVDSNNRVKSSVALASAQRASAAIVPSTGKKVVFN